MIMILLRQVLLTVHGCTSVGDDDVTSMTSVDYSCQLRITAFAVADLVAVRRAFVVRIQVINMHGTVRRMLGAT